MWRSGDMSLCPIMSISSFAAVETSCSLRGLGVSKRAISVTLESPKLWQPAFFDHILRSDESYGEKWNYVRENPVRAGLVKSSVDWPYQGEIVLIDRA
jgi:hypothetical protein